MPFAPHYRLTISGILGQVNAPLERFSFRLNLTRGRPELDGDIWSDASLFDYVDDVRTFWTSAGLNLGARRRVTEVKFASIDATGKYDRAPRIWNGDIAGAGLDVVKWPLQTALAITLHTPKRGPRGRGRFFLPAPLYEVANDGLIAAADAENIANQCQTFLNNLNNRVGLDTAGSPDVCVASATDGVNHTVDNIRVGRAYDTIRSRRQSLPERYSGFKAIA